MARSSWTNRRCLTAKRVDCGRPIARTMSLGKLEATVAPATKKRPPGQNMTTEPIRPTAKSPSFDFKSAHGRSRRHRLALRLVLARGSRATTPELNLPIRGQRKQRRGEEGGHGYARPCPSFFLMAVLMIVLIGLPLANHAVDRLRAEMATRGRPEHQGHVGKRDVRSTVDADLQHG